MNRFNLIKYFEGHSHLLKHNILNEDVYHYQIEIINKSKQKNFLKISNYNSDYIGYDVTSLIPINTYFMNYCDVYSRIKELFISFIEVLEESEEYLLNLESIVIEEQYCFYDLEQKLVKLVYVPIKRGTNISIHDKVREVFLNLIIKNIDMNYISSDRNFIFLVEQLQNNNFDIYVFKKLLQNYMEKTDEPENSSWIKKIFKTKQRKMLIAESKPSYPVDEEMTVVLDTIESYPYLEFIDNVKVSINKKRFLIGRSTQLVDYAFTESLSLGRIHAEIIEENFIYYLIDINSKNGTYINGVKIASQKRYKIDNGDEIKFANKVAYFKL